MSPNAARSLRRVLGLALCLAWAFCAYPPTNAEGTFLQGMTPGFQTLMRLGVVGLVPTVLFPLFPSLFVAKRSRRVAAVVVTGLWVAGWLGSSLLAQDASPAIAFAMTAVAGGCVAYFLVRWGLEFCSGDVETAERDFVSVLIVTGVVSVFALEVPGAMLPALLVVMAIAVGMLAFFERGCQPDANVKGERGSLSRGALALSEKQTAASLVPIVLRTALAVTLVSFVWCVFSMRHQTLVVSKTLVFGVGFVLAGVAIRLFLKHSPSVGFAAAARWVLPAMAVGLLLNDSRFPWLLVAACLMLSVAHAAFEMSLRMQVVSFARRHEASRIFCVGWGFAAIMAGAFLGPSLYLALASVVAVDTLHLTLAVLVVLVIVGSLIPLVPDQKPAEREMLAEGASSSEPGDSAAADPARLALLMGVRYGLTNREAEILHMLLEGRSRPYIRDTLYVSISTVDTHVRHIYAKVGVHNKQDLIDLSRACE
ncbi:helix-turn-helix transcriptional regulator [Adlercreutzia aquisgranensis]|uniref:helix-turn-helix transcriptional regulator n=1 Tax=Adlercreutzia aquisgranensis TaxID=2941323 RepID=UPI00203BA433|nr:helix-turn-helix transcriptional regulator [Adlercreutzia aquisgranensis]